jgi:hypothetical protein
MKKKEPINCPIDVFPEEIQTIIEAIHDVYGAPNDFYLLGILATASAAIGNSLYVTDKRGEKQKASIYGCIVSPPSSGKSPSIDWCLKPLAEIEEGYRAEYTKAMSKYLATPVEEREGEPQRETLYITDATTEALTERLSKNKTGIVLHMDELIKWLRDMNKYRSGSDDATFMHFWNYGSNVSLERVSKSLFCKNPFITIIGGTQPGRIEEFTKKHATDSGFFHRILFCYPESEIIDRNDKELKPIHYENYSRIIKEIHDIREWIETPKIIELSNDANGLLTAYSNNILRPAMRDNQKTNTLWCEYLGKLEQYCLRFSLILETLNRPAGGRADITIISEDTMEKAIKLTEYFKKMAARILDYTDELVLKGTDKIISDILPDGIVFTTGEAKKLMKEKTNIKSPNTLNIHLKKFSDILYEKQEHGVYIKIQQ